MSLLDPNKDSTSLGNMGKGLLYGGVGMSMLLGINEIRKLLEEQLNPKVKVLPKSLYFGESIVKESVDLTHNPFANFSWAFGVPLGAYFAYNGLDYLKDLSEKQHIQGKLKKLENELTKMSADKEINDFLDGFLSKSAGLGDIAGGAYDLASTFATKVYPTVIADIPFKYGPTLMGLVAGLGGLAGWNGTKYLMNPEEVDFKDIISNPSLVYKKKN